MKEKANKSQAQIAKVMDISQSNYSKYELGVVEPNISAIIKLADYYGVSLDYLCERDASNKTKIYDDDKRILYSFIEQMDTKQIQKLTGYANALIDQNKNK